jgi:hypothetical protein
MKKIMAVLATLLCMQSALACRYYIDENQASKELVQIAIAAVESGNSTFKVVSHQKMTFDFFESKPTAMCPEEITITAEFYMTAKTRSGNCHGVVEVIKIGPLGKGDVTYKVNGLGKFRCDR